MVLETLTPTERAVFVLREVFDTPYEEIARAMDKTPAAVRQIAHRAREHVAARRPRVRVDRAEQEAVVQRFLAAAATGDVRGLMDVLAPDVVLIADGGGFAAAARKPIAGAERVVTAVTRGLARFADLVATPAWFNGMPGARIEAAGSVAAVSLEVRDGRISRIYAIANPHKLARVDTVAELSR
jgi:RNA polymerase sigma-70 factor (ECF subfamily)